jgi:hypothetical protein
LQRSDYILHPRKVKDICDQMGIEFKCQTIGVLLTELLDNVFNSARITCKISDRENIRNRQKWICYSNSEDLERKYSVSIEK